MVLIVMKKIILNYTYLVADFAKKFCLIYTCCVLVFVSSITYANANKYAQDLQRFLAQYKQYIYDSVYFIGTADSIKLIDAKKISESESTVDVEIAWTGWINKGTSQIRLHFKDGKVSNIYELKIEEWADKNRKEQASIVAALAAAAAAAAAALSSLNKACDSE